jgi:beta-galactosidase
MVFRLVAATVVLSLVTGELAMGQTNSAVERYFPAADMMMIGTYYYPDAWPEKEWARDIANIKKLNLEYVHMGEFAWAFMEPEEGHFDFGWLDKGCEDVRGSGAEGGLVHAERNAAGLVDEGASGGADD